jgi:hypothetical protein
LAEKLDPFVRRLVLRLHDPSQPLSRNRHFHTFDTPEGRKALKLSRRLKGLQTDLLAAASEGQRAEVHELSKDGELRLELRFVRMGGRRVSSLTRAEFELLCELPGVQDALGYTRTR